MCPGHRRKQLSARLCFCEPHCDNLSMFWMLNLKGNKSQLQSQLGSTQALGLCVLGLRLDQRQQQCPKPKQRKTPTVTPDEAVDPTSPAFRCPWLLLLRERVKPFHPLSRSGLATGTDQIPAGGERSPLTALSPGTAGRASSTGERTVPGAKGTARNICSFQKALIVSGEFQAGNTKFVHANLH